MRKLITSIVGITCVMGSYVAYADNESAVTSKSYVDAALSGKQDILESRSGDIIVTYPRNGGSPIVHEIKDELGSESNTSDTGLPTAESVDGATGGKIERLANLPNNNIVTYSMNTYEPTSTPIYDNTVNTFGNGVVRAGTLNSAIGSAVQDELIQVDENNVASATGTLWRINTSAPVALPVSKTLDASINGTGDCYRRLNGQSHGNGTCSADTLSYLGANTSSNKSGKWGAVFPYGDVSGISVCSSLKPTAAYYGDENWEYNGGRYIANSSENQTLSSEYTSQAGNGTLSGNQFYCWCKMENPAVSSWVFRDTNDDSSFCALNCAYSCVSGVLYNADFRGAVFGAVAQ